MLRAMIAKKTFDIRHKTDCPDITDQQNQTKDALDQVVQPRAPAKIMFGKPTNARRKQEEQADADRQRQAQCEIERRAFKFFIFTRLGVRGKGQRAHAQPERVPEQDHAAEEWDFSNARTIDRREIFLVNYNVTIGRTHGNGKSLSTTHHNAFDNSLPSI